MVLELHTRKETATNAFGIVEMPGMVLGEGSCTDSAAGFETTACRKENLFPLDLELQLLHCWDEDNANKTSACSAT